MKTICLALAVLAAVPASAAPSLTTSKSYPAQELRAMEIQFPAGDLEVDAADGDEISVTMTARCPIGGRRCRDLAERVRLVSETRGRTQTFRLEGLKKNFPEGLSVDLKFLVPRYIAVKVGMGAGDLNIRSVHGDIDVEQGAGDVSIRVPEREVGSVEVNVGVGDANLRRQGRTIDGSGFISKRVRWSSGTGSSRVNVNLGAGDVDVSLE